MNNKNLRVNKVGDKNYTFDDIGHVGEIRIFM